MLTLLLFSLVLARSLAGTRAQTAINVVVDISKLFNNKAASLSPGSGGDFDGRGTTIPANFLPSNPNFYHRGFNFKLAKFTSSANDNVIVTHKTISIPADKYALVGLLAAGDGGAKGIISQAVTVNYDDGSKENLSVLVDSFKGRGLINTPYTYHTTSSDSNVTSISYASIRMNPFKTATSLTFGAGKPGRLHVFAMSLFTSSSISNTTTPSTTNVLERQIIAAKRAGKASTSGIAPVVRYLRSTTKLNDTDLGLNDGSSKRVQLFEIVLHNLPSGKNSTLDASKWITTPHTLRIDSASVQTAFPATVKRLRAGLSARFYVGVVNADGVARGTSGTAIAVLTDPSGKEVMRSAAFSITAGIPRYKNGDLTSLIKHESPMWFDDAKFGIFVHWGVYAVPAFAPVGLQYAEWYWFSQHLPTNKSSPTWAYHKKTYGVDVVYDDFIRNFTASKFHAENLVDLFHNSGASYFVQVTKHHDGIAIFDTKNTSNRNTVKLGPKRDLLNEIMTAAKTKYPTMRRGTYFSLPEWYHPDYKKFGFGRSGIFTIGHEADGTPIMRWSGFPGGEAHNAYKPNQLEPYTGYVKSPTNFVVDVQGPQMKSLMDDYQTEILWCDIGRANFTSELIGTWFNDAYDQGRSVALNNRCGVISYDFSTPEYKTYHSTREDKWESSAGLDPKSYGYNAQTPPDRYANATKTITSLVDIVSKNGNYLVDIGPREDGTVVQEEINTLTAVGDWLKYSAPGIMGTKYWNYDSQEGDNIRFTTTDDAFYIFSLVQPDTATGIQITSPVPFVPYDQLFMLGGTGKPVNWTTDKNGIVTIMPTKADINRAKYVWGFEVRY